MQKVYVTLSLSLYFLRRLPSLEVGPILPLLFFPHSPLLLSENQHFLGYFNFV